MAIHLDPSLPVISQPHVFWERVGGEGQARADVSRAFVHHPFRSGSRFIRIHVFRIMPCFRNQARSPFIRIIDTVRRGAVRRSRREINHLADKRGKVTNEVDLWDKRRIIIIIINLGAHRRTSKYYFRRNIGPERRVRLVVN